MATKPAAEVTIGPSLVLALLQEQHADLAHLPLIDIGEGWDNKLFRLGEDLTVRLPRRAASAVLIEQEQRWLSRLSQRLPLPKRFFQTLDRPSWQHGDTGLPRYFLIGSSRSLSGSA